MIDRYPNTEYIGDYLLGSLHCFKDRIRRLVLLSICCQQCDVKLRTLVGECKLHDMRMGGEID
jgi:hypothetical protein